MMKIVWPAILILVAACSTSKEVVLNLSNPQGLAVPFGGYYIETVTGDSIPMNGTTPRDYVVTLEKGEQITGKIHKDGPNMTDTLQFRVLVDDDEILNQKMVLPSHVVDFAVTAQ